LLPHFLWPAMFSKFSLRFSWSIWCQWVICYGLVGLGMAGKGRVYGWHALLCYSGAQNLWHWLVSFIYFTTENQIRYKYIERTD